MPFLLVYAKDDHCVLDYILLSRKLAHIDFDDQEFCLCLQTNENHQRTPYLILVKEVPIVGIEGILDHLESVFKRSSLTLTDGIYDSIRQRMIQDLYDRGDDIPSLFKNSYTHIIAMRTAALSLDDNLSSCMIREMRRSRVFRKRCIRYVRQNVGFRPSYTNSCSDAFPCDIEEHLCLPQVIEIDVQWSRPRIDYAWEYRMFHQVVVRVAMEESMAWLSTLGGAYSALGDYFRHHAVSAGDISVRQLRVALELQDPLLAARCRLFYSQSIMQRGDLRQCKKIIWAQYQFAVTHHVRDEKLIDICRALWNRLAFMYKLRKAKKTRTSVDIS